MSSNGTAEVERQADENIGLVSFLTAVAVAVAIFTVQFTLFLLLRNKLARILSVHTVVWFPDLTLTSSPRLVSRRPTWFLNANELNRPHTTSSGS